jgi:hypothetical protein
MWSDRYDRWQIDHAMNVACRAWRDGRLNYATVSDISKYISGCLRHRADEDAAIQREIEAHKQATVEKCSALDWKARARGVSGEIEI